VLWVLVVTIPYFWLVPSAGDAPRGWAFSGFSMLGAFVFGADAAMNGACAFSSLARLAGGQLRSHPAGRYKPTSHRSDTAIRLQVRSASQRSTNGMGSQARTLWPRPKLGALQADHLPLPVLRQPPYSPACALATDAIIAC
jgi:hypothetical protein